MAEHFHPRGVRAYYSTDGNSYTEFVELMSCKPSKRERGHSPNTVLNDTEEQTTPGWIKATDADWKVYLTSTIALAMETYFAAGTTLYWKITYPLLSGQNTAAKWIYQGYIFGLEPSETEALSDDKIMETISIRRTTPPVHTAGS